jgi:hypothetical protein
MAKIKLEYTRLVEEVIEIPDDKFEILNHLDDLSFFDEWNAAANFLDKMWEDTAKRVGDDLCDRFGVYTLDNKAIAEY